MEVNDCNEDTRDCSSITSYEIAQRILKDIYCLNKSSSKGKFNMALLLENDSNVSNITAMDYASEILLDRNTIEELLKNRVASLRLIIDEKHSCGSAVTDEENSILKACIPSEKLSFKISKRFQAAMTEIFEESSKKIDITSLVNQYKSDNEFKEVDRNYSGLDLQNLLQKYAKRVKPKSKKVSNRSTHTNPLPSTSDFSNNKRLLKSVSGLFCLLRLFITSHEVSRSEAQNSKRNGICSKTRLNYLNTNQIVDMVYHWQANDQTQKSNATWINKASDWTVYVEDALKYLSADPAFNEACYDYTDSSQPNVNSAPEPCPRPFVEFRSRTNQWLWLTPCAEDTEVEEKKILSRIFPEWFKYEQKLVKSRVSSKENKNTIKSPLSHKSVDKTKKLLNSKKGSDDVTQPDCSGNPRSDKKSKTKAVSSKAKPPEAEPDDIPQSLYPTNWVVSESNEEQRRMFQIQEANRFARPWLPFVYKLHGYSSVVGPLRSHLMKNGPSVLGMNGLNSTSHYNNAKPRSHPLLRNDRPAVVGLADIVRDAVARLPNGEGTRWDIVTLAKDSGFLIPRINERQLHQCISGALDRLQSEPDTPVVYRPSRRVWVYKHRHRTPEGFMKIFKQQSLMHQTKRNLKRARPVDSKNSALDKRIAIEKSPESTDVNFKFPKSHEGSYECKMHGEKLDDAIPRAHKVDTIGSLRRSDQYSSQRFNTNYDDEPSIPDIDDLLRSNDPDLNPDLSNFDEDCYSYYETDCSDSTETSLDNCKYLNYDGIAFPQNNVMNRRYQTDNGNCKFIKRSHW